MAEKTEPRRGIFIPGVVALLAGLIPSLSLAADAKQGETVFRTCAACHNDQPGALGPSLKGVYGRKAGELEGFYYSNAMKLAGFVWDADNLKAYIADPQAKVKGNRMPFSGLRNPGQIDDVVAYLQTLK